MDGHGAQELMLLLEARTIRPEISDTHCDHEYHGDIFVLFVGEFVFQRGSKKEKVSLGVESRVL